MIDHDLEPAAPLPPAPSFRWSIVVGLLAEPAEASRDLIDRLSAWPAEVRQHECADEPEPRGRGKRLESERKPRAFASSTSVIDEGISQIEPTAKGSRR